VCFADVADNPGGGGRGNTMYLLRAFAEAGVKGALFGVIYDPPLAAEAHKHGLHYNFTAEFNRDETTNFSEKWSTAARVAALTDGNCIGRRGIYAGLRLELGPCAALAIGGITVVVISHRVQCADPIFFEMMGLDIARARSVAVKSRGHFRGGFDEFFRPEQIVEVDLPGLTSPMLNRFQWTRLPRPVIPLDKEVEFGLS
jgi:microcystin degradation protein MlrC